MTITGAEVALEKVVEVPRLRGVTLSGGSAAVTAMITGLAAGLLAGCGAAAGRTASAGDGFPSPMSSAAPTSPGAASPAFASPGVASPAVPDTRSAAQLLQQARDAFLAAPSVHVTGTAVRGADAYVVDARLKGADGGTATVKTSGETVQVIRIGGVAYVGGDLAFWRSVTGSAAAAQQRVGTYLRTGADEPNFAAYVAYTQPQTYADVLPDPAAPATVGATTTIRGAPAVAVRDQAGSTLDVARTGAAVPLRLDGLTGGQVVFLDFADYGAPVPLPAPPAAGVGDPGTGS